MSYKHGRSAKYPDVSKPHFWNSGRGPYPSGAAHVSPTAVAEAHQTCGVETTPTAGSPRSVTRWRSRPADVRILRGNDLLDGAPDDCADEANYRRGSLGKYGAETRDCLHVTSSQASQNPRLSGGAPVTEAVENRRRYGERPGQIGSGSNGGRGIDLLPGRFHHAQPAPSLPRGPIHSGERSGERSGRALIRLQRGQECR